MFYFAFSLCIIKPRRRLLYLLVSKNMVFLRVLKLSGEELCSGHFESSEPVAAIRVRAAAALGRGSCDLVAGNMKLRGDKTVEAISLQDGDSLVAIAGRQLQLVFVSQLAGVANVCSQYVTLEVVDMNPGLLHFWMFFLFLSDVFERF